MSSPFVFNVARLPEFEQRTQTGPTPVRIGPAMVGIAEGDPVTVDATLTSLGSGVLVDAVVSATLSGQCVRCLREIHPDMSLHISQVFSADPEFITGEKGEDGDADEVTLIERDHLDLLQAVLDEAGLTLPFNPTCDNGCEEGSETPAPDGISGEDEDKLLDPRWAGLEKFK